MIHCHSFSRSTLSVLLISFCHTLIPLHAADEVIDGGTSVTLPGSQTSPWTIEGNLTVGNTGTGTLSIGAGNQVTNTLTGVVGTAVDSNGSVTVTGAGATWQSTGNLTIGKSGSGSLDISSGGRVTSNGAFYLGDGGTGALTISGTGSEFYSSSGALVSRLDGGRATISISAGGSLSTTGLNIGSTSGSTSGSVLVTGLGSTLTNRAGVTNLRGQGSSLRVEQGAVADFAGQFSISGSDITTVVDGAGSKLTVGGHLSPQATGDSSLVISNGGKVEVKSGGFLQLGSSSGYTLRVESGSSFVTTSTARVGSTANTTAHLVVTGAGSTWTSGSDVIVTHAGTAGNLGNSTLTLTDGGKLTVNSATKLVTLGNAANTAGTLNIGTGGVAGILEANEVTTNAAATATGQVNFNHTGELTFSAKLTSARLGVAKSGLGTTILTGANTYSLPTAVNAGTLLNNGSLGATEVRVADGAFFGGTGIHAGSSIFADGAYVTPGSGGAGTFTTASATFDAGSGYLWELSDTGGAAGTGWDLLSVSGGGLSIAATESEPFHVKVAAAGTLFGFDPAASYEFVIATATGGISGFNADAFAIDTTGLPQSASGEWSMGLSGDSKSLLLSYNAVPEPSALALLALGLGAVAARRSRR